MQDSNSPRSLRGFKRKIKEWNRDVFDRINTSHRALPGEVVE